jgi:prephenate dehydrogenase
MLLQNKLKFEAFKEIHDLFTTDPQKYKDQFNEKGREIQDIIRRYENMLCSQSESTGYGKYSSNLAEKFQQEIKKIFPKIDSIGIR